MKSRLPKFGNWLLKLLARYDVNPHLRGDFDEEFSLIYEAKGFGRAWLWYWTHLLRSLPVFIKDIFYWRAIMIKNYLKIALRNLQRHKGYSFINIAGFAIGMACCLLILLYVRHELSYDRFHENAGSIYRVVSSMLKFERMGSPDYTITASPLAQLLMEEYPEVINAVRLTKEPGLIQYDQKRIEEEKFFYAEPTFFEIFSFPLVKGDPETVLKEPFTVLITEEISTKYFGTEDPINKTLRYCRGGVINDFKITGVLKNIPQNSHIHFDFLASFQTLYSTTDIDWNSWMPPQCNTYVRLREGSNPFELEKKLENFVLEKTRGWYKVLLQPLKNIHLHSHVNLEFEENGRIVHIYLFSTIGFFIIFIACINYMNITTARSTTRSKEIGLRKTIGATRQLLIRQFLSESILWAFAAFGISMVLVALVLPSVNSLIERDLGFHQFFEPISLLGLGGFVFLIGIISGSYPAFYLSSFQPINTIKGASGMGIKKSSVLRRLLVVIQFVVTVFMMAGSLVVGKQLKYMRNSGIQFNEEQIITLPIKSEELKSNQNLLKNELVQYPQILDITVSSKLPYKIDTIGSSISREDELELVYSCHVDSNFFNFYGIELLEGRNFSEKNSTDVAQQTAILNSTAVNAYEMQDPLGRSVEVETNMEVIGVIEDFHFHSFHHEIRPLVFCYLTNQGQYFSIKIRSQNMSDTLSFIERKFEKFSPDYPFEYSFLDESMENIYHSENKLYRTFVIFTIIALAISCLGLFSLTSFSIEQRTKEIGIRKVLGASIPNIVHIFSKELVLIMIIANAIACPIAFYFMHKWLQNFAYRIDLHIWIFILSGLGAFGIALLTISYQSLKAATANPVDSLRYE